MNEEKITRNQIIKKLSEYKGKRNDPVISERIDFIIYLIDNISDDDLNKSESLKLFITDFDNPSRLSNLDGCLAQALYELQKITEKNAEDIRKVYEELNQAKFKNEAIGNEISRYTKNKKKRKIVSIVLFVVFGIFVGITAIFAFLDTYEVLEYGGIAAGTMGIFDFLLGAVAFIVERVNDSKTVKTMEAAENVKVEKPKEQAIDKGAYVSAEHINMHNSSINITDKSTHNTTDNSTHTTNITGVQNSSEKDRNTEKINEQ